MKKLIKWILIIAVSGIILVAAFLFSPVTAELTHISRCPVHKTFPRPYMSELEFGSFRPSLEERAFTAARKKEFPRSKEEKYRMGGARLLSKWIILSYCPACNQIRDDWWQENKTEDSETITSKEKP